MVAKKLNVLFLCTGNSARSILAEAILNWRGREKFNAYSAGSHPKGKVNPLALDILKKNGLDTGKYRSKSWDEFSAPDAPKMDFVFTVCDNAANEICPVWPGRPMTAHWGIADPDRPEFSAEQQQRLFFKAYTELDVRIKLFISLPFNKLEKMSLQAELDEIGRITTDN